MEDDEILAWAASEERVTVTVDKDFGELAVALGIPHHGIVRLPDVPATARQRLMKQVITQHESDLGNRAIVTVQRGRIRARRA